MLSIDLFSISAVYVRLAREDCVFPGGATAFLYEAYNRYFVVTNWHVVTGRNHETGNCMATHGGLPDRMIVSVPQIERKDPPIEVTVQIYDSEGPCWSQHPIYGRSVDIAALPIEMPRRDLSTWIAVNHIPTVLLRQRIGMQVFVIGFPFERSVLGMPVWKQGTFASEPILAPEYERFLLIDTASRPGMSGSPVIQRHHGEVQLESGQYGRIANGDGAARFVGIYSGRLHTNNPMDAQLGRVWPAKLVQEVVGSAALQVRAVAEFELG